MTRIGKAVKKVLPTALGGHTLTAMKMLEDEIGVNAEPDELIGWRRSFARKIGLTPRELKDKNWYEKHQANLKAGRKYASHYELLKAYAAALVRHFGIKPRSRPRPCSVQLLSTQSR